MEISLFEHNKIAYESSLEMLEAFGKAAVIHPTGTGKSFIGFKLCADFPDKCICWLSPSEYIFKTQTENFKAVCKELPQNIKFYTYAKLMNLSDAELAEISPDYVILDEFHRCGARMWGAGVQSLLDTYPNAKILGLSTTAIRYLDNQRNMADELFDGCVSSEITLADAIVKGILRPPKYVLSLFKYQGSVQKFENRIRSCKSRAVRDAAQGYLDELRRALAKADGLDVIFDKHITDRCGKYIIFCSNYSHLKEMTSLVGQWFGKIDKDPHVYTAYADDPETHNSFEAVTKD